MMRPRPTRRPSSHLVALVLGALAGTATAQTGSDATLVADASRHDRAGAHDAHASGAHAHTDAAAGATATAAPPARSTPPQHPNTHGGTSVHGAAHAHHTAVTAAPDQATSTAPPDTALALTPIPVLTDADRAAAFPPVHAHMQHAGSTNYLLQITRLEHSPEAEGSQSWEAQAWIGSDLDRVLLRSEGEREGGRLAAADAEVLFAHSVSPWWDVVVGVQHEFGPESARDSLAVGLQGMAPYKFEVQATAYFGRAGRRALNLEVEYELLLTNRLILQPLVEVDVLGQADTQRHQRAGLSRVETGLRLRYEFSRRVAPYIGLVHERRYGDEHTQGTSAHDSRDDTRWVAGLRLWF